MLIWNSNFQIPNSGVQSDYVYAFVEQNNVVKFYADQFKNTYLFEKHYDIPQGVDPYDYLLILNDFTNYTKQ